MRAAYIARTVHSHGHAMTSQKGKGGITPALSFGRLLERRALALMLTRDAVQIEVCQRVVILALHVSADRVARHVCRRTVGIHQKVAADLVVASVKRSRLRIRAARRKKAPGELDHPTADPGVAGFGKPLFPPLGAALVRRTGQAGVAR